MGADAHGNEVLKNLPDEVDALVMENIKTTRKTIGPIPQRAGKLYADFAKSVNDSMEERDAALTNHKVCALSACICVTANITTEGL